MEQSSGTIGFFALVWLLIKFGLAVIVAVVIVSCVVTLIGLAIDKLSETKTGDLALADKCKNWWTNRKANKEVK